MAEFSSVFLLVLLSSVASQALEMSRREESREGTERTPTGTVASSIVPSTSYLREKEKETPMGVLVDDGVVNPGTETEETRLERTVSCERGRCRTGRKQRCPRGRRARGPPVVHLYMRYLTWRSNWQPGGRRWRQQALRNSTVYQILPWKVSWRRGVGNFKFKVNCHVPKDDIIRESELVLSYSMSFQSAARKGAIQPPYRLVLMKVVRRGGVRKHRHVTSKTVYGNETSPWVIFNISQLVHTWRTTSRLKHGLRLTIVSMTTGSQVDQSVTKRLFNSTREATLLAAYVQEGVRLDRKENSDVFRHRSPPKTRPRSKGNSRTAPDDMLARDHVLAGELLRKASRRNDTKRKATNEETPQGPELLRDWLAYRGWQQVRQSTLRHDNSTAINQENRGRRQVGDCRRHDLHIVFNDVILPEFILQPPRYNAYYCAGNCRRPFPVHMNATNHAMLLALLHEKDPRNTPAPCCIPLTYSAISVMEKHGEDIKVKQYPNMRVESCGCR